MAKKKAKKVVKKDKKKKETATKKPKGPTQKELFEMQVDLLRLQAAAAEENLELCKEELRETRSHFEEEVDSKEACVGHLRRELRRENERRLYIQDRLQTERDLQELVERRALGKFALSDRSREANKSLFLQQKLELEGKLFLLEQLRLQRNSQIAELKTAEDALAEKISALCQRSREEEMIQVDTLLQNRDEFLHMCKEVKNEWRDAFKLRLPVHAKKQLEDNVKLRAVCREGTKDLLQAQGQNRILKNKQESLELEQEIQDFVEENAENKNALRDRRLQRLLEVYRGLLPATEQRTDSDFSEASTSAGCAKAKGKYGKVIQMEKDSESSTSAEDKMEITEDPGAVCQRMLGKNSGAAFNSMSHQEEKKCADGVFNQKRMEQDLRTSISKEHLQEKMKHFGTINLKNQKHILSKGKYSPKGKKKSLPRIHQDHSLPTSSAPHEAAVMQKLRTIREHEIEQAQLEDTGRDVGAILKDQAEYRRSLEQKMEENIDRNGAMISGLLRAGKIFETRCSRAKNSEQVDLDYDLLHQIRKLLDLCPEKSEL